MFKYRVVLTSIVLLLTIVISSAYVNENQASNLIFVDSREIGLQDASTSAVGEGNYRLETEIYGQTAHLELRFWNLEPNTRYVLWCITLPTGSQGQLYSAPCTASDAAEISVRSDTSGSATLSARTPALQNSNETRLSIIALVYDLEGHTYGAPRTEIAVNSYVQYLAILPTPQS